MLFARVNRPTSPRLNKNLAMVTATLRAAFEPTGPIGSHASLIVLKAMHSRLVAKRETDVVSFNYGFHWPALREV